MSNKTIEAKKGKIKVPGGLVRPKSMDGNDSVVGTKVSACAIVLDII